MISPQLVDLVTTGGVSGVLLALLWALFTRRIALGREVKDKEEQLRTAVADRDRWQKIAFEALHLGQQVTSIMENGK